MRDRVTAERAARDKRHAMARLSPLRLDSAGVMALQRAAGNAATGGVLSRLRVLARRPDEAKVRARAHELWERSGGGVRSHEEDEANYFEALRQVEIEERAHALVGQRGGHDPVANYYEAERQIAEERKPAVEAAKPVVAEAVKPVPVLEEPKPTAKYVPKHKREGFVPSVEAKAAPVALGPGVYDAEQLTKRLGFERKAANHLQRDVDNWNGFAVHVSVYHQKYTFDELHVKLDLGHHGSAWFFFDTKGTPLPKSSSEATLKKLLRADRWSEHELPNALKRMREVAQEEADWVVSRLKK
jgi:hypothetical protein